MLRCLASVVALVGLLCGFAAAPYTHMHHASDAEADEDHAHASTFVHTHTSSHDVESLDHHPSAHVEESVPEEIWSLDTFVFPQSKTTHAPAPALIAYQAVDARPKVICFIGNRLAPWAHGPPAAADSPLRAPPSSRL
jgi:hypothetical protein